MNTFKYAIAALILMGAVSCTEEDDTTVIPEPEVITESFNVTITNTVNYLGVHAFNTPEGATAPAPVGAAGGSYAIDFKAFPGTKLSFATMQAFSNDWFYAPHEAGITLFDENGMPITGNVTDQVALWDAGSEEEDPKTIAAVEGGGEAGDPDDNKMVRVQMEDVSAMIEATLAYDDSTKNFTLTLKNLIGAMSDEPVVITPGIVVVHAQDAPLFKAGEEDWGYGLVKIAEQGNPMDLHAWFTEVGTDGAPLRLSSSHTVFAPAVVYAFTDADPLFTQGSAAIAGSGLESIAEDGNSEGVIDYLTNTVKIPAAKSNEAMPIGPGQSFTFTLNDVPAGSKLGFISMMVNSNDWFYAANNSGIALFDSNDTALAEIDANTDAYLYDAGTEENQEVGFGLDQPMRQSGANTGAADTDTTVRRVESITDMQFGKGEISSANGVVAQNDARGGYNMLTVEVTKK